MPRTNKYRCGKFRRKHVTPGLLNSRDCARNTFSPSRTSAIPWKRSTRRPGGPGAHTDHGAPLSTPSLAFLLPKHLRLNPSGHFAEAKLPRNGGGALERIPRHWRGAGRRSG